MAVRWTAFPLHPETPSEGRTLEDLFAGRNKDIPGMLMRLRQAAAAEGLPFGDRKMTFNSRLAQELGKWAESKGRGDRFHDAAFRAYFADGNNIADPDVLIQLAESVGLPENEAAAVLKDRTFRKAVDEDWLRSRNIGVTAVPTFHYRRQVLVGAQPYDALRRLIRST